MNQAKIPTLQQATYFTGYWRGGPRLWGLGAKAKLLSYLTEQARNTMQKQQFIELSPGDNLSGEPKLRVEPGIVLTTAMAKKIIRLAYRGDFSQGPFELPGEIIVTAKARVFNTKRLSPMIAAMVDALPPAIIVEILTKQTWLERQTPQTEGPAPAKAPIKEEEPPEEEVPEPTASVAPSESNPEEHFAFVRELTAVLQQLIPTENKDGLVIYRNVAFGELKYWFCMRITSITSPITILLTKDALTIQTWRNTGERFAVDEPLSFGRQNIDGDSRLLDFSQQKPEIKESLRGLITLLQAALKDPQAHQQAHAPQIATFFEEHVRIKFDNPMTGEEQEGRISEASALGVEEFDIMTSDRAYWPNGQRMTSFGFRVAPKE